jgi:hypothetical protein
MALIDYALDLSDPLLAVLVEECEIAVLVSGLEEFEYFVVDCPFLDLDKILGNSPIGLTANAEKVGNTRETGEIEGKGEYVGFLVELLGNFNNRRIGVSFLAALTTTAHH